MSSKTVVGLDRSTLEDIVAANAEQSLGLPTRLVSSKRLTELFGRNVLLKLDSTTAAGSYKVRGTAHAVRVTQHEARGYICASTGNHAIAVAVSAQAAGKPCLIVVPKGISATKKGKLAQHGVTRILPSETSANELQETVDSGLSAVLPFAGSFDECQAMAVILARELSGVHLIHPFDDQFGFVGHCSIGAELLSQLDALGLAEQRLRLIVPAGGGGYGTAALLGATVCGLNTRLTLVELLGQDCCHYASQSLSADPCGLPHGVVDSYVPSTAVGCMGAQALQVVRELGAEHVIVERRHVQEAYRKLIRVMRLDSSLDGVRIELAPAMAYASLAQISCDPDEVIVLAISGGNMSGAEASEVMRNVWLR